MKRAAFSIGSLCSLLLPVILLCGPAAASGLLVPRGGGPPLEILSHQVEVIIDNQVARTRVTQVFRSPANRTLEADYVFPLPVEAGVSDFAMWIAGERRPAVVAERMRARRIYDCIVRAKRDPGLLEQTGKRTFRMRVFPILPRSEQKIELTYDETVDVENGTCGYVYPLRMKEAASKVKEDLTLSVRIRSVYPILRVDSPSHRIDVMRKEGEIVVGLEEMRATLSTRTSYFASSRIRAISGCVWPPSGPVTRTDTSWPCSRLASRRRTRFSRRT